MKTIQVLIVEDIHQVCKGLATVLTLAGSAGEPRIEIKGFACNGDEAVRQARNLRPDVILIDLEMPGLDCYAAIQRIKAVMPAVRVITLSIQNDVEAQQRALAAGADSYVVKGSRLEDLLQAVTNGSNTINNNQKEKNHEN